MSTTGTLVTYTDIDLTVILLWVHVFTQHPLVFLSISLVVGKHNSMVSKQ